MSTRNTKKVEGEREKERDRNRERDREKVWVDKGTERILYKTKR